MLIYCDLCGFTALGDRIDRRELVDLLNEYLTRMAEPLEARGGQVLKFMGNGMSGTFELPAEGGAAVRGRPPSAPWKRRSTPPKWANEVAATEKFTANSSATARHARALSTL